MAKKRSTESYKVLGAVDMNPNTLEVWWKQFSKDSKIRHDMPKQGITKR